MIQLFHWWLPVSLFLTFDLQVIIKVDGLYYTNLTEINTVGCAFEMGSYIYWNVVYILSPIILTVSVTEFVFLLRTLFCTQPVRTDYLLK